MFESTDCVERALAAKPIMLYGNHRYINIVLATFIFGASIDFSPFVRLNVEEKKMRAPRDGNTYQDRRQDDRGNRGSQDNLRGAGHPGGRGWTACPCYNIVLNTSCLGETCVVKTFRWRYQQAN